MPKQDLRIGVTAFRLLNGYDVRVPDFDGYGLAGTYQPYSEFDIKATKGIGKYVMVDAGFDWRLLDRKQTASAFNHGYKRAYLSLSTLDLLIKGLSLNGTGDFYRGEDNSLRDNFLGGSFNASKHFFDKRLILTSGTAFYLYRYNYATANESHNVQTYFGKVEGKLTKNKKLGVKSEYEFEHNDISGFHTFNLGMTWDF